MAAIRIFFRIVNYVPVYQSVPVYLEFFCRSHFCSYASWRPPSILLPLTNKRAISGYSPDGGSTILSGCLRCMRVYSASQTGISCAGWCTRCDCLAWRRRQAASRFNSFSTLASIPDTASAAMSSSSARTSAVRVALRAPRFYLRCTYCFRRNCWHFDYSYTFLIRSVICVSVCLSSVKFMPLLKPLDEFRPHLVCIFKGSKSNDMLC